MSINPLFAVIHNQYQPTLFFCAGLLSSILLCTLTLAIESKFRCRRFASGGAVNHADNYRKFRNELSYSARHVGFTTDEIHELQDRDFHSE